MFHVDENSFTSACVVDLNARKHINFKSIEKVSLESRRFDKLHICSYTSRTVELLGIPNEITLSVSLNAELLRS